jgi:hypothetical protein
MAMMEYDIIRDLFEINRRISLRLWHVAHFDGQPTGMSPRLIFPQKGVVSRVSEQEAKVLCCNVLNDLNYYYSVETPTQEVYRQTGDVPIRARSDVSLYIPSAIGFQKVANMEFKAHTPPHEHFAKDVEKLIRERMTGNWFHILRNVRSNTLPDVFAKLRGAFLRDSQTVSGMETISIVFSVCILSKRVVYMRHFCYEGTCHSYEDYVRRFFDASGPGEEAGWQVFRIPATEGPSGKPRQPMPQPEPRNRKANGYETLRWSLASLRSDCFDLQLENPELLDAEYVRALLQAVEKADGVNRQNFDGNAAREFRRWLGAPHTPLLERAYALLSNWFLTDRGCCRDSACGYAAGQMWDALFCARPERRLTDPKKNYKILPEEFALWWERQQACQRRGTVLKGQESGQPNTTRCEPAAGPRS